MSQRRKWECACRSKAHHRVPTPWSDWGKAGLGRRMGEEKCTHLKASIPWDEWDEAGLGRRMGEGKQCPSCRCQSRGVNGIRLVQDEEWGRRRDAHQIVSVSWSGWGKAGSSRIDAHHRVSAPWNGGERRAPDEGWGRRGRPLTKKLKT